MRRATVFAFVLIAASSLSLAQDRALISGDAEDKQDTPVSGVRVTLRNESLRIERTTATNSDGLYFFAEVAPADGYIMTAEAPGIEFAPQSVQFEVQVGETRHILPSFIGEKSPISKLRNRRRLDSSVQAVQVGGPGPQAKRATLVDSKAQLTKPDRVALVSGGLKPRPVAYVSDQPAASDARWTDTDGPARQDKSASPAAASASGTQAPAGAPQSGPPASGRAGKKAPATRRGIAESSRVPLDTLSTAVSSVITSNQLRNLPFFNRNFLALGLLDSGIHDVPAWSELKDTTFSISGQRPTSNAFLLDGMDNEASSSNQAIPFQVNDAIQEFRVVTATSDAQFGRNIGGVVNIVTRRGTAKFHGSVFGFFASDSIDASSPLSVYNGSGFDQAAAFAGPLNVQPAANTNSPSFSPIYQPSSYNQYVKTTELLNSTYGTGFCNAPNATSSDCNQLFDPASILAQNNSHTQPLSSQQFGAQAGGSFLKRWYWFGDYEGTRIDNPNPIFERVPSSYDGSHLDDFKPGTSGYQDAQFAGSVLALYPQSNVVAIPDVLEFYQGYAPNYTNVDNYLGRIDFTQSDRTDWTFRYNLQDLSQLHDDTLPSSSTYPGNGAQRAVLNQNLVTTFTHRFSDHFSNVLRAGFTRFQVTETPQDANFNAANAGLPSGPMQTYLLSGLDPQYSGAAPKVDGAFGGWANSVWFPHLAKVPVITPSLDGLFPFARLGAPLSAPGKRRDTEGELVDNIVWFKGKHTVRSGFDLRRLQNIFDNGGFSRGMVVSGDVGEFTSDSETCIQCRPAAFTNPSFDYALKQPSPYNTTFHSYVVAGYLQDTWRVKPNLTVNLGVRYEYFSPPSEVNHQLWNFDPAANGLVQQDTTQVFDPFGNQCGAAGRITNESIYPANSRASLPWNCSNNGNGSFVVANTMNFEPRVGIAWATPSGDTVVRAGFGIFYDEIPASLMAQLAFNRPTPRSLTNPQALYDQNFRSPLCGGRQCGMGNSSLLNGDFLPNNQAASVPFALSAIDPSSLNNPLTRQVSFSLQRQIRPDISAEVAYIGNFMANLPATTNSGYNDEWFCTASAQGNPLQPCDAFSNVPVFTTANVGYGNYNAFLAKVTTRGWHGFQARASYTYSKALDTGSSAGAPLIPGPLMTQVLDLQFYGAANPVLYALGSNSGAFAPPPGVFGPGAISANLSALTGLLTAGVNTTGAGRAQVTPYTIPQDPYNFLRNDYGPADFNQTNRFILEYTWEIPTSKPSQLLSGWLLSGVFTAESGQPFTIFSGPIAGELTQRVSLTGPLTTTGNPYAYIGNTSSIVLPGTACEELSGAFSPYVIQNTFGIKSGAVGTPCLGNSARNQFTGPAYVDFDMALQKTFKIREVAALSFRAESYNLFNRPNYYNPISSYSLDGVTPYSQFGQIKSAHNARQFQFAARMSW
jgi:Carboxypeptidase regulatory-like domain/TonB dependent receptor